MQLTDLLKLFRLEVDDLQEPYFWSDYEFYIYLNEAQDVFLRLIGGIADSTSAITSLQYKNGKKFVNYDPRILRIKSAVDEQNRNIEIQNIDSFGGGVDDDYGMTTFHTGLNDDRTGDVRYLLTDIEQHQIRLYPTPDHDGSLHLYVYRRALEPIVDKDGELELSDYHHLSLLEWVKYRAYMKQDSEVFDTAKAEGFRRNFSEYIAQAGREKMAREDRKRLVRYGGL